MGVASLHGLVGGVRSRQRCRFVLVFLPGLVSNCTKSMALCGDVWRF